MEASDRRTLADRFRMSLGSRDWATLGSLLADDAEWMIPGHTKVSGQVEGADAIVDRFQSIAAYGVAFDLEHVLVSRQNFALAFHNTAVRDGRCLDMRVVTACRLSGDKIGAIETFVSDIDQLEAFFV